MKHCFFQFRLPPLVVEGVSVILVSHKALLYFRGKVPSDWAGTRLMHSLLKYSVFYFTMQVATLNFFSSLLSDNFISNQRFILVPRQSLYMGPTFGTCDKV